MNIDAFSFVYEIPGKNLRVGSNATSRCPVTNKMQSPKWKAVLQCVAVCYSVLQCVAVCYSVLQCVAVCCSVLHCDAVCCFELSSWCSVTNKMQSPK